ncbi:hypothetical protein P175DRAFT_0498311 [Aspergillus ochraceoroseus IBT 24754]|uniref:Inheritance of peroxisomes protein 1 n=1 Tax=Aspergillus ochraceoroseus IBT 24754 TaxID=1392256 RepID=A0A2T5M9I3_9EURO|nr:uncharacterized protein P175DRAFT_0498311 [Aspergillus ochraceoroseus IBT 24754]PTU25198.1 hypothetical protein P175DRAFT_0498311 [Aspergillus ochraceoroseus IBT 24754]
MSHSLDAPPPQHLPIRRSFTLPTKLNPARQRSPDSFKPSENDLFYHPSAKVVHFAPRAVVPIPSSSAPSDFDYPVDTVETLPWKSPTERTVAFAPLRLEKVHGLTVFLKCGSVVHAILKNSQCWCVDGESTFVLRIRPLTYYRIELPNETEQDKTLVAQMKDALPKILRYEVTPCPFQRGFTVEIPEEAKAPRRRKAWRPKGRRESAPMQSTYCKEARSLLGVATPESLSASEDTDGDATDDSGFTTRGSNSTILETIRDDSEPSSESLQVPRPIELPQRSVSETQQSFHTLLARFEDTPEPEASQELLLSSSVDSFHSIELPISPYHASDPYLTPESLNSGHDDAHQIVQEIPGESSKISEPEPQEPPSPKTKELFNPQGDEEQPRVSALAAKDPFSELESNLAWTTSTKTTDSNPHLSSMSVEFRRRSKASRKREISPMPPASTLVLATPEKHDATSLIQKTCTLVLVPPIQLLIVLIHIAARIVIGPAINTTIGGLDRKFECHVSDPHEGVDDFDLPLAPDCPRKPSISGQSTGSDPWGLD